MKHKKEEVTNSTLESQKESFTEKVKLNYNWSWDFENHEKRNCFSFFKKNNSNKVFYEQRSWTDASLKKIYK